MKYTICRQFPFIKRVKSETAAVTEDDVTRNPFVDKRNHLPEVYPVQEVGTKPYIVGVDGVDRIGAGEPWFDPRASLAMNEQNRQYFIAVQKPASEIGPFKVTKVERIKIALKVYGHGSAKFFGTKTGLGTKTAGEILSEMKSKGKVTATREAIEDGMRVLSYKLK